MPRNLEPEKLIRRLVISSSRSRLFGRYNPVMDRPSFPDPFDEGRAREPVFRSDLEERRPEYPRSEGGGRSLIKRLLAPLAAVGLLLAKFKSLALLALKAKFLGTALTMVVSVGAYALLFPVWFAVGFVVLIWVHEMGHVWQLRREGIPASAPMFIPFLGALVMMKQMPKNALAEARVGLAGPVVGSLGSLGAWGIYELTHEPLFLGLAYVGFFLNLFNLLPMLPLDGGRAVGALSPVFWLVGIAGIAALVIVSPNPVLILIALLGGMELWRRWRARNTPEGQEYYEVDPKHRLLVALAYFGLIAVLAAGMAATFVADPAALQA
jgi:Zn-dependent protease